MKENKTKISRKQRKQKEVIDNKRKNEIWKIMKGKRESQNKNGMA